MKKPEMEIVEFQNEDVIATSDWSGKVLMIAVQGEYGQDKAEFFCMGTYVTGSVWMNSDAWKYCDPNSSDVAKYSNVNSLDGVTIDSNKYAIDNFYDYAYMHFNLNSHVGSWEEPSQSNDVYNIWATCTGDGCHYCN